MHALRARKYGDPDFRLVHRDVTDEERFWLYVTKGEPDECWEFTGDHDRKGYGRLYVGISKTGKRLRILAHRWAYERFVGPIPDGLNVLHTCDNPPCVNPAHLWPGTQVENVADCIAKGRRVVANRKLTDDQVRAIRLRTEPHRQLAREYGVGKTTITQIKSGKTWHQI